MTNRGLVALGAVMLGACSPPETGITDLFPIIVVDPDRVDFGGVGVAPGLFGERSILISNAGKRSLEVTSITLEGQVEPYTIAPTSLTVAAGEDEEVTVTFAPLQEYREYLARAVIESDDEETPVVTVPIVGSGVEEPVPAIEIRPHQTIASRDGLLYGETDQIVFEVANVGQADLHIEDVTLEPLYGGDPSVFTFEWRPVGRTIAPGGADTVLVRYAPDDEVGETAIVHILSNDPEEPDTPVYLLGMGGGPYFEPPVADIACPGQVLLTGPVWAHFDGSGSYDPAGFGLTYEWSVLLRPPGSDLSIPLDPANTPEVDLYVDLAGPWLISLVVRNELGAASLPAFCAFDAIPEDNIHIELIWAGASSDMDLHLVQTGYDLFSIPEDCYWCNKSPDWGVEDLTDDDPRLDIDDRAGYGPENINVYRPADGQYTVAVHMWRDNGTPNEVVTVSVWLDGVQIPGGPMVQVMTENDMWEVGDIYVSDGVSQWIPNGVLYDPGSVSCPN